jgi:hypothetical protein
MELIYIALMIGVSAAILASLAEAILAIHRPNWGTASARPVRMQDQIETTHTESAAPVFLQVVETVDRRTLQLPFVGTDRRKSKQAAKARTKAA